ncbi:hypothetical protein Tco_0426268 [Tanacetum coccineum]
MLEAATWQAVIGQPPPRGRMGPTCHVSSTWQPYVIHVAATCHPRGADVAISKLVLASFESGTSRVLSYNELKIEGGFERAFATLFDQDVQTFTGSMLLNLDQLEKQLDKEEFQEAGSMDAFRQFCDTLIQHMESVKKSIDERAQHKREYDSRMNERHMQSKEGKVDSSKELDAGLFVTECSGTKSDKQVTSSSSGNYLTHAVDADIRPVNDQVPFVEVQLTAQHNVLANEQ